MDPERAIPLDALLGGLAENARITGTTDKRIAGITIDSRSVQPGTLFVALRGEHTDGHRFVAQAFEHGASAAVVEHLVEAPAGATLLVVPDSARALSRIAATFYGNPSQAMRVIGITGTNGKTTTSQMIASMLTAAGMPCGTVGTIGAHFAGREWPLENTTPLAPELQALLAQMREMGANAVAMEVSSHALALQRVADIRFAVGALTNVTRDHLDFHKTFEAYAAAKRRLFEMAAACVFNLDDELGARWEREVRGRKPVATYGLRAPADVHPQDVDVAPGGSSFTLDGQEFRIAIPGRFNLANALCAIAVARVLGVSDRDSAQGLAALTRVAGRMEHVRGGGVDVIVDYAHTPDALENVLRTLRETASRRLLVVFGCGGDRDRGKRPQMGEVAARYADHTYVTSDNPRTEDPMAIIGEILPGVGSAPHTVQSDRRAAIEAAVAQAEAGDVVLVAGKGHENYQVVGTQVLPFDDVAAAREALAHRGAVAQ